MKLTIEESTYLCELYQSQNIAIDKLGGTPELKRIIEKYNQRFSRKTQAEILTALIDLRKSGRLKRRFRNPSVKKKPTWGNLVLDYYEVVVKINVDTIRNLIKAIGDPLTRQEVYDFLQDHPYCQVIEGDDLKTEKHLRRLFPELLKC